MSISTSTYQHISFSKYLIESEALSAKEIVKKWMKVVPYRQKYINESEVDKIGDLLSDPDKNKFLLGVMLKSLQEGTKPSNSDLRNVVYSKPIKGNLFVFEDETIKQMEKMLRRPDIGRKIVTDLEKAHIEKQGFTLDDISKVGDLSYFHGMISLVPSDMAYYFDSSNGMIHVGVFPHIYKGDDADVLKSIIYHEVRHAYDAYFAGIKRGEYDYGGLMNRNDVEVRKYYKSLGEARAYTDQIIYLVGKFKKKFNLSTKDAVARLKNYLLNKSNKFCSDFPPLARDLFSGFADEIAKNPKLAGFSEESAMVYEYEDVETFEKIGKLYEKIMETFRFSHNHEVGEM